VNPYTHFPLRSEEAVTYDKTKWSAVIAQFDKFNQQLKDGSNNNALDPQDRKELDTIIENIKDTMSWHRVNFTPKHYEIIGKLLQWPIPKMQPVLHILRLFVLHPSAATHYGKKSEKSDSKDLIDQLCVIGTKADKAVTALLAVRTITNCFNRRILNKVMASKYEEVFDLLSHLNEFKEAPSEKEKTDEQKQKDEKQIQTLRASNVALFINYAIMFLEDAKNFEAAKVLCLSSISEYLSKKNNGVLSYRLLVVIGTLIFNDNNIRSIASDLEIGTTAATLKQKFEKNQKLVEVCNEIEKELTRKDAL